MLILRKGPRAGTVKPGHKYAYREGEPGNYRYHNAEPSGRAAMPAGSHPSGGSGRSARVAGMEKLPSPTAGEPKTSDSPSGTNTPTDGRVGAGRVQALARPQQPAGDLAPAHFAQGLVTLWCAMPKEAFLAARQRALLPVPSAGLRLCATREHAVRHGGGGTQFIVAIAVPQARLRARGEKSLHEALVEHGDVTYAGPPLPFVLVRAVLTPADKDWPKLPEAKKGKKS